MIKKVSIGLLVMALSASCVSKKIYNDLESKYTDLKKENRSLADDNSALAKDKNQLELDRDGLKMDVSNATAALAKTKADYAAAQAQLKALQSSYNALEKNSDDALQSNMKKNRELLDQLDEKGKALALEQERLSKSAQRLQELEDLIAAKEASMKKLKETLSKALNSFEGKGLTVQQKTEKYTFLWRTNCCLIRGVGL